MIDILLPFVNLSTFHVLRDFCFVNMILIFDLFEQIFRNLLVFLYSFDKRTHSLVLPSHQVQLCLKEGIFSEKLLGWLMMISSVMLLRKH